jgi:hypothetical protein
MEKAYDKMWHQGLVLKLRNVGLASTTIGLILNFLSNRSISLKINGKEGAPIKLKSGTAQGAILSPLIFNCWVSDIPQPENQKTRLSQYADDVATWSRMKSVKKCQATLQRYNTRFLNWCKRWRMKLSASKTKVLLFHRKKIRRNGLIGQKIDQTLITPSKEATFLGIVLDPKLKLQKHHRKIMTELRRRIKLFRNITGSRSRPRCDSRTCLKILKSMIVPITTYGAVATSLRSNAQFQEQDVELRKAVRMAIHAPSSIRNDYVEREGEIPPSKTLSLRLARKYLLNENRSAGLKELSDALMEILKLGLFFMRFMNYSQPEPESESITSIT